MFLLKDVPNVGTAGEVKKVEDGFARNFLLPRKLAIEITSANEALFAAKTKKAALQKEVVAVKTLEMAEKIKATKLVLKKKMHTDGKLYAAVSEGDVVSELAKEEINITKRQVEFGKAIKSKGAFEVTIKLTPRLKPTLHLDIIAE